MKYYINGQKVSKTKFYSELKKDYWYDNAYYESFKELKEFFETFNGTFDTTTELVNDKYYMVRFSI